MKFAYADPPPGIKNGLTRQQRRSITYPGIATAFAEQWG
jgi:hypothetical protein